VPVAGNLVNFELSGPGKILGVGNGDPSCHEPDFYPGARPAVDSVALNGWRMLRVPDTNSRPEVAVDFDDTNWAAADVNTDSGPLNTDECAVFRAHVTMNTAQEAATNAVITFGMINDDGLVYVNGQFAGEVHNWSSEASFEIRRFLREGDNTVAVVVRDRYSTGGVNKGVKVEFVETAVPEAWKRSVFNGLAQVVVQSDKDAGEIRLTAHGEGLTDATAVITAQAHAPRPAVP
jgi:beta-galactosidase